MFIKDGPSMLIDFIDWAPGKGGVVFFFCTCLVSFCFSCKGVSLSFLYILSRYFSSFFAIYYSHLLIKKKILVVLLSWHKGTCRGRS